MFNLNRNRAITAQELKTRLTDIGCKGAVIKDVLNIIRAVTMGSSNEITFEDFERLFQS